MATQIVGGSSGNNAVARRADGGGGSPSSSAKSKAQLIYKMDDFAEQVNGAVIIAREDGVITVSEDR